MCDEDVYLRIDGVVIDAKLSELQMAHHGWACAVPRREERVLPASDDYCRGARLFDSPRATSDLARRLDSSKFVLNHKGHANHGLANLRE
jgi:hypothetical protein